jgi:hypothetical protein
VPALPFNALELRFVVCPFLAQPWDLPGEILRKPVTDLQVTDFTLGVLSHWEVGCGWSKTPVVGLSTAFLTKTYSKWHPGTARCRDIGQWQHEELHPLAPWHARRCLQQVCGADWPCGKSRVFMRPAAPTSLLQQNCMPRGSSSAQQRKLPLTSPQGEGSQWKRPPEGTVHPVCLLTQVELNREAFWGGDGSQGRTAAAASTVAGLPVDKLTASSSGPGECVSFRAFAILDPRMLRCRAISRSDEKRRPPRAYLLFYPEVPERQCEGDQTKCSACLLLLLASMKIDG